MSDLETFGPVVITTQIGDAVTLTLQKWLGTYLDWICRQIGEPAGWLVAPQSYVVTDDPDHFPEDQPPAVVIVVSGTDGEPRQDGQRLYRSEWLVHATTFVEALDRASTDSLSKYYAAAMRAVLTQKIGAGGLQDYLPGVAGTKWRGDRYGVRINDTATRTLGSSQVSVCLDVRQIARALGGPLTVPTDPSQVPADFPTVTTATTTFTN